MAGMWTDSRTTVPLLPAYYYVPRYTRRLTVTLEEWALPTVLPWASPSNLEYGSSKQPPMMFWSISELSRDIVTLHGLSS